MDLWTVNRVFFKQQNIVQQNRVTKNRANITPKFLIWKKIKM